MTMRTRTKRLIWVFGVIIVVSAVAMAVPYARKNGRNALSFRTAKVERGDILSAVTATGTVNAVNTVQVGSQVSGTISTLNADFNSTVRQGDVVAQIDPTFLQAQVDEAEANLEKATAALREAQRNYARATSLRDQSLVSQASVDEAETALETSRAQVRQVTASVNRSRINLRYATIKAPISGVVISRDVDVGQTVAASLQAPTLFTIAEDLALMKLELSVDEADIGKVNEGQKVTFTVDAYPEESFDGVVSQIRLAPVTVQNVVTYTVIVKVANPLLRLRPGMTASASILVDERRDVLKIPTSALHYEPPSGLALSDTSGRPPGSAMRRPPGERPRGPRREDRSDSAPGMKLSGRPVKVWTPAPAGKATPVRIRTGISDRSFTEVTGGGLSEGQEVIVGAALPTPIPQTSASPFGPGPGGMGGRPR